MTSSPSPTRISTATLIQAPTGSGKTSLLHTVALWGWEKFQAITDLYTCDPGAYPTWVQRCVNAGILRVWRMRTRAGRDLVFETLYRATQGWWPRRINPRTGEVEPDVELIPPTTVRYRVRCPQGHELHTCTTAEEVGMLPAIPCATCGKPYTVADFRVERVTMRTPGFPEHRIVCYDGLSSMQSWQLHDLGQRFGRLELKGEEAAIGGKIVSGDLSFGGTTRSHVGFAQSRAEELVNNTLGIPYLVESPIFTALTHETMDEGAVTLVGPKLAGNAKTDEAASWFGNVLEAQVVQGQQSGTAQRRLYLSEFTDERGRKHLLKNAAGTLPGYIEDPEYSIANPDQTGFFTGFSLGRFFDLLDEAVGIELGKTDARLADAPGLPATEEVEIGIGEATVAATKLLQTATPGRRPSPSVSVAPVSASPRVGRPATTAPRVIAPAAVPPPSGSPAAPPPSPAEQPVAASAPAGIAAAPPAGKVLTPVGGPSPSPAPGAETPSGTAPVPPPVAPPVIPRAARYRKPSAAPKG